MTSTPSTQRAEERARSVRVTSADGPAPLVEHRLAEAEADIAFLLARAGAAGTASFGGKRWTGMSSNSLVALAYGGEQTAMPADRSDYAACVRTYVRLPKHRRTTAVREGLAKAKEAYLDRHADERFPGPRNAAREAWERDYAERIRRGQRA